jgi:cytochrome d ubiquinol oxidase subunit II
MDLNTLWFVLIAVLFIGFFFLEGFDYGVGILLPVLGKTDGERRGIINTIGPFWDANETWMVTAGGAMFAAFPGWYATLFSGFYLALALMLVGLILRGVGFEFRSKDPRPGWRNLWDVCIFVGSFVPALLWGVAFGNIVKGVPIDGSMNYTGGFFNLLNPYALVCGLAGLALFTLHGALFLIIKGDHDIAGRARTLTKKLGPVAMLLLAGTFALSFKATDLFARNASIAMIVAVVGGVALLAAGLLSGQKRDGVAFAMTGVTIACSVVSIFAGLFPRVMISSTNPEWNLTITNASSSHYTLTIMSVVALMFVPVVLAYQIWTYWVFRQRVTAPTSEKPA